MELKEVNPTLQSIRSKSRVSSVENFPSEAAEGTSRVGLENARKLAKRKDDAKTIVPKGGGSSFRTVSHFIAPNNLSSQTVNSHPSILVSVTNLLVINGSSSSRE